MPWQVWAQTGEEREAHPEELLSIHVNGEPLFTDAPVLIEEGRILVPIRHLVDALQGTVQWLEDTNEAQITSALGDVMVFRPDHPVMWFNDVEYRMDVTPVVFNERIYIPLRHAAQFLHAEVEWNEQTSSVYVVSRDPYLLEAEDTIKSVSERFGIDITLLIERNGLENREAMLGFPVKFIIPDIMANKIEESDAEPLAEEETVELLYQFSEEEIELLAKITMVEAGYEPYEGQLAVANVVINRVKDSRFPDTIRDVVYAPGQFPPAHNGLLDKAVPNESVWKAVQAALEGENNIEDAVYFHNPKVSSGRFWNSLKRVKDIGNHRFYK